MSNFKKMFLLLFLLTSNTCKYIYLVFVVVVLLLCFNLQFKKQQNMKEKNEQKVSFLIQFVYLFRW